jgi:hypothetical protein
MSNRSNTKALVKAIRGTVAAFMEHGDAAFTRGMLDKPINGICSALAQALYRGLWEHTPSAVCAYDFMCEFLDNSNAYGVGLGLPGELNDTRIMVLLVLDALPDSILRFYIDQAYTTNRAEGL